MSWLQSIDTAVFRFVNQSMSNPVFDRVMPALAGHSLFVPGLVVAALLFVIKGGKRGRLFALFLALALGAGDGLVVNTMKKTVARPRPCVALADTQARIGCSDSGSMPSAHSANWFAAATICFIFYRRSWRLMFPLAALVAFSRVYNGVHYPSDVIVGSLMGVAYAAFFAWGGNVLWRWAGQRWIPLWWQKCPSLIDPDAPPATLNGKSSQVSPDAHWLHIGYVIIGLILAFRLGYIGSSKIDLGKDEAYQWLWSKHLALSYFSKPLLIAYIQWMGTHIWGDTAFGVRFFSPVIGAGISLLLLRFFAREVSARVGVLLVLASSVTPMLVLGSTLLTIDPPLVLFWTAAMIAAWKALQPDSGIRPWFWAGLWAGLGFLCKYAALYLWICWALYFVLWRPARVHLRRPGPWIALLVNLLCTLPVIIWNNQNHWITATHVASNAGVGGGWSLNPVLPLELIVILAALANPIFFVLATIAMFGFWKKMKGQPLPLYFFCMGTPVFFMHLVYSLHSRIQPNWVATSILPAFCLMAVYWDREWLAGVFKVRRWYMTGLVVGFIMGLFGLYPDLTKKLGGSLLPPRGDPLRRVQGWKIVASTVEAERQKLAAEGKPAFVICDHYGLASLITFYTPEAKKAAIAGVPSVYYQSARLTFTGSGVKNFAGFAGKLKLAGDPVSRFIVSQLSTNTLDLLAKYQGEQRNRELGLSLLKDLDKILLGPCIYDAARFEKVSLSTAAQDLLGQAPKGVDLIRLNRLLIESAYPMDITPYDLPDNQFYFWPEFRYRPARLGQNAIFVAENDEEAPIPAELLIEFESVTNLGIFPLEYGEKGRVTRRLQLWSCRNLR